MVLRALAATGVATSLFGSAAFGGHPTPPPAPITIGSVTANGTGCPPGTAAVAIGPDQTTFTVTYSNYIAQAGPSSPPSARQKNCQLNLLLHLPGRRSTYAIVSVTYMGFASLAPGASGTERASYHFQGDAHTTNFTHHFPGGFNNDWQTTDTVHARNHAYCGKDRTLTINTELQVDPGTSSPSATSFMEMDSTDGSIQTVYHLAWKKCQ
ncbi:DUF4360 domain-containing protein [Streptomyces sp. TP-A0356]|uniref:DUF4360 domain-containing protein n=1 Tax=Streptomyces sp. TP-A0356 TaxID=1359208 RepID=UPI0006E2CCD7|nr:DUF4360 domain-containing protein [Streptomyces sp. TP-A0356]